MQILVEYQIFITNNHFDGNLKNIGHPFVCNMKMRN